MGYNTTILFLNDCADDYQRYPEKVVANILDAMNNAGREDHIYYPQMSARPTAHADEFRLYAGYGNCLMEFGYRSNVKTLELRKQNLKEAKWLLKREEEEIRRLEKEASTNG